MSIDGKSARADSGAACGCVDIAVAGAAFKFDKLYSYALPAELASRARIGARVLVPFGGGRPRMGVILAFSAERDDVKEVIDVEKGEPLLSEELTELVLYLKKHTLCSYDDAVKTVLPKNSRLKVDFHSDAARLKPASRSHVETAFARSGTSTVPELTEKQQMVLDLLTAPATYREIYDATGASRGVVDRLLEKGVIKTVEREKPEALYPDSGSAGDYSLTPRQQQVCENILAGFAKPGKPDTTLLHGVTSSGKTLIYYRLIREMVKQGRTALLLVPEIALATQLIYRLKQIFGDRVGVIHSGLSDTQRQLQWQKARTGGCDLIVGTRSAVFAPLSNIGLIIVDEEQEQTYLSEQNPRYHAVMVAGYRARRHGAKLLLSSATPSVETYYAAQRGMYNLARLPERYKDMPLPEVRVIDMRSELLAGNSLCVSEYLKNEIDKRLSRNEQSVLLLNRRGYRTVSICSSCKAIVKCTNCDAAMVYHKQTDRYICHYCGRSEAYSESCKSCGGSVRHTGIGTQKIEEELELLFPGAKVLRLDADAVGRKHSLAAKIAAFSKGEYDIIIGTQMIAKGLDFENVTLAGVLSVDQLLLAPSFRANERAFSMLTQVVGRSGRGDKEGEAVIQTVDPENPIIRLAAKQDYASFYRGEIVSRKLHLYPPFCKISSVSLHGPDDKETAAAAEFFAALLEEGVRASKGAIPIRILGPAPTRVAYVGNQFRYRITLKSRGDSAFRAMVNDALGAFYETYKSKKIKVYVSFYDDNEL